METFEQLGGNIHFFRKMSLDGFNGSHYDSAWGWLNRMWRKWTCIICWRKTTQHIVYKWPHFIETSLLFVQLDNWCGKLLNANNLTISQDGFIIVFSSLAKWHADWTEIPLHELIITLLCVQNMAQSRTGMQGREGEQKYEETSCFCYGAVLHYGIL